MSRLKRKNEHLLIAARSKPERADFTEISFVHDCLPELDLGQISLETEYLGRTHRSPLFINAITGGTSLTLAINASLAAVAAQLSLPMAVGSQLVALESPACRDSFTVVRKVNPHGQIWANIGSYATVEMALQAIEMIRADALQIHLNVAQELAMNEGECSFAGALERIKEISKKAGVPVIVKEVGFGMAAEAVAKLAAAGVSALEIGGRGGTDFLKIETSRRGHRRRKHLRTWGIPSAISLIETLKTAGDQTEVLAGGGIWDATDLAKALALGARSVGMAGLPLYYLMRKGRDALVRKFEFIEKDLKAVMLKVGAGSIGQLAEKPLVISGYTAEWLEKRGLNPGYYARRSLPSPGEKENDA
jgi:isopentenyl-diphosphate Delta-isomerase